MLCNIMGEMADFYNEQVEEMEFERGNYHMGLMSDVEAYEKGIIDELGYEANAWTGHAPKPKVCRCCGEMDLHWAITPKGKWFLVDRTNKMHECKKNPFKKDFKPNTKKS